MKEKRKRPRNPKCGTRMKKRAGSHSDCDDPSFVFFMALISRWNYSSLLPTIRCEKMAWHVTH